MISTVADIGSFGTVPQPSRKKPFVPTSARYSTPSATWLASRVAEPRLAAATDREAVLRRDHDHARVEPHALDGGEAELEPAGDLEARLGRARPRSSRTSDRSLRVSPSRRV